MTKYKYTGKFFAFKGMVFISKLLYKILSLIAFNTENAIPDFKVEIESGMVQILKNKTRLTSE